MENRERSRSRDGSDGFRENAARDDNVDDGSDYGDSRRNREIHHDSVDQHGSGNLYITNLSFQVF